MELALIWRPILTHTPSRARMHESSFEGCGQGKFVLRECCRRQVKSGFAASVYCLLYALTECTRLTSAACGGSAALNNARLHATWWCVMCILVNSYSYRETMASPSTGMGPSGARCVCTLLYACPLLAGPWHMFERMESTRKASGESIYKCYLYGVWHNDSKCVAVNV